MEVKLGGVRNFRDFGGLPTGDGHRVRRGWLFRSEALDTLDAEAQAALAPLAVAIVCDLRSARERAECPNRLPLAWSPQLLHVAENRGPAAGDIFAALRERNADAAHARAYMLKTYTGFPEQFAPLLAEVFERLADGGGPLLVHCAAGKDRTGFICAMLHHALGVLPEAARADYLLSNQHFGAERIAALLLARVGLTASAELAEQFCVRGDYLDAVIAAIETEHGSIDAYLAARAGLTPACRERLRNRLLEDVGG